MLRARRKKLLLYENGALSGAPQLLPLVAANAILQGLPFAGNLVPHDSVLGAGLCEPVLHRFLYERNRFESGYFSPPFAYLP